MEYRKANLKEYTRNLEEMTEIFANKLGIKTYKIYFCAINDDIDEIACFRTVDENAKEDIDASLVFFLKKQEKFFYYGKDYLVTNRMICFKYLDGDFIVAFHYEFEYENANNDIFYQYIKKQIENYLLYIVPLILHESKVYSEFLIESQISAATKSLIEEKITIYAPIYIDMHHLGGTYYYAIIEELSEMTYEGEYLKNKCLLFAEKKQKCDITISNNVHLNEIKKVRKLLEITYFENGKKFLGLLYNGDRESVSGLISNKKIDGNYIRILFEDKGRWTIHFKTNKKESELTICNSKVYISDEKKNIQKFIDIYKEMFNVNNADCAVNILKKAQLQKHGTMLIFSDHAWEECRRLNNVGYEVCCNKKIGINLIEHITCIDGATFIDLKGNIVGIGMILDGEISDKCQINNSRGSRYNSAIKYTYARSEKKEKCIAVVVSEDGDVNIIKEGKWIK